MAAWTGSTNLGDELLLDALRRRVEPLGCRIEPISVDAARTTADHGVDAVDERRPRRVLAAIRRADALVFGPGGLLQDESSALNPPRHLGRVVAARRAGVPVVATGLGVGPLTGRLNRALTRRVLDGCPLHVRDVESARVLASIGLRGAVVGADLVFGLPAPDVPPTDRIVVCLRPPTARRFVPETPARRTARLTAPALHVAAEPIADLARALDLPVRLVSFEAGRDDLVGGAVADHLTARGVEASVVVPTCDEVLAEVATSRLVVSMRYHGGIASILGGRPLVLVGHVDKVRALVEQAGVPGVVGIDHSAEGWSQLVAAGRGALAASGSVSEARDALRAAESVSAGFLAEHLGG